MFNKLSNRKNLPAGALLITIFILAGIFIVTFAVGYMSFLAVKTGDSQAQSFKAAYAAESGEEKTRYEIKTDAAFFTNHCMSVPEANIFGTSTLSNKTSYTVDCLSTSSPYQFVAHGNYKNVQRDFDFTYTPPPVEPVAEVVEYPSGLVNYWSANGNAIDSIGSYNGTLLGGTTFAAGKIDQAFSFDGSDDYITIPNSSSTNFTSLTVSMWVNPSTMDILPAYAYPGFINKGYYELGTGWEILTVRQSERLGKTILVSNTGAEIDSNSVLTANTWYHIVGVIDGPNSKLFINGVLDNTSSLPVTTANDIDIEIGRRRPGATGSLTFAGLIDEIQIYNRALSDSEVLAIYNAQN